MKKEFNIEIYEGHCIIIDGDQKILVGTGSPMTISNSDFTSKKITFNEQFEPGSGYNTIAFTYFICN